MAPARIAQCCVKIVCAVSLWALGEGLSTEESEAGPSKPVNRGIWLVSEISFAELALFGRTLSMNGLGLHEIGGAPYRILQWNCT